MDSPHLHQAAPRLAEQAPLSVVYDSDDHGVGAGVVFSVTLGAAADLATPGHVAGVAADGAEAVAVVPVELGASLGDDA